jgi:uncharacterized C2H2 Zn-finger protein
MVVHTCETCEKEFDKKSKYVAHINKKFKCKPKAQNFTIQKKENYADIDFDIIVSPV